MKKLFFFFVLVFLLSVSALKVNASHLTLTSCSYSTSYDLDPSATTPLFRASEITNTNIEAPNETSYPYFIQCRGNGIRSAFYTPSSSRPALAEGVGWLYSSLNSHILTNPGGNIYYGVTTLVENNVFPSEQISCGTISGASGGDGNAECTAAGWNACVYSASGVTNAHVAACSGAGVSYGTKMCCKVGPPPSGLQYIKINPKNPPLR